MKQTSEATDTGNFKHKYVSGQENAQEYTYVKGLEPR